MASLDSPVPVVPKGQKRCSRSSCSRFYSALEPHSKYVKCVPRGCNQENPCDECILASSDEWVAWQAQQIKSSSRRKKSSVSKSGNRGETDLSGQSPRPFSTPVAILVGSPLSIDVDRISKLEDSHSSLQTGMASLVSLMSSQVAHKPPTCVLPLGIPGSYGGRLIVRRPIS